MLCYRCGSHVPDNSESCATCGQKLSGGGLRQATGTFSRRRPNTSSFDGAPFKQGEVVSGRYEIKDAVGSGPVGFVFRARDNQVDVEVALKVINPRLVQTADERKAFAKAMRGGRKLNHPNIVRIYEEGEDADRPYFTMQYLEGLTLRKIIDLRLAKNQFFTGREIEPIIGQIATALEGAHKVGPHADLKPENVIVLPDLLKLSDLGLSLAIPRLPFLQAMKSRKADRYLAPEYVEGGEVDARSDIYSLGVIIGEMLAGVTPDGAIPELSRIVPELPPQLEGLYRRALNPNPLARQRTPSEVHEELARAIGRPQPPPIRRHESTPQPPPSRTPLPPPPASISNPGLSLGGGVMRRKSTTPLPPPMLSEPPPSLNGSAVEELPPDATQPIDPADIPVVLGLRPPPPPEAAIRDETEVMNSYDAAVQYDPVNPAPPSEPRPGRSRAAIWLVVLTLSGLVTGSVTGYWALQRIRRNQAAGLPAPDDTDPAEAARRAAAQRLSEAARAEERRLAEQKKLDEQRKTDEASKAAQAALDAELAKKAREEEERAARVKKPEGKETKVANPIRDSEPEPKETKVVSVAAVTPPPVGEDGCPEGMKAVSAGVFKMGTPKDDPMMGFDEKIVTSVQVEAFCIDQFEFPNKRGVNPTVNVSWNDARRLCEGKGKRLCSEEEWEKACKGPGNARFPYGSAFDAEVCNTEDAAGEDRVPTFSGKFSRCRSGYGVADLSGNVAEWTSTPYAANSDRTQKGGAYDKPDYASRCAARKNGPPGSRSPEVGFRCCVDAPGK